MHRIPRGRTPCPEPCQREPIFVMTALLTASSSWVLDFPTQSLGYVLADNKYDVWLGNLRGNTYGKRHKRYSPRSRRFWNFSFHEHGVYDAPAQIDYILKETKQKSLLYVGLSQGTLMFFTMMSEKPEYNDKARTSFFFFFFLIQYFIAYEYTFFFLQTFKVYISYLCEFIRGSF
ncbi:hypothetical protein HPB47_009240 [Ixodes persulcatus]|uniref:Uncharacterized protein n=1 Tax=Ixodes persulcatus TaxID=34615 RepID=A0AC60P2D9_IXOPE|nr:hypothetical protein HPB47_009240 [Ixodes persulcatus]